MTCKTLLAFSLFGSLCVVGCGGSGSSGGGTPPPASSTITSVTASCNPTSVQTGQTSQCSATVMGTGSYATTVTWSANSGTISSSGLYTASATVPSSGAATITATSTQDATKSGTAAITVTTAAPVQPTVTLTASPSTITVGSSTTLTWSSTNTTSCTASGAWSGTEATSGSTTETPSAIGTATYTLTCTGAAGSATASATVTVTAAPIVIDSISPNVFFNPTSFGPLMTITGSGFAGGELFYASGYPKPVTLLNGTPPDMIQTVLIGQMRPRFINVYGTQSDGTGKSNTVPFASLGTVPIAAACNDYVFADSQGPGTIRRFNRADGSNPKDFNFGGTYNGGIAVDCNSDGTTNAVVINQNGSIAWSDKDGNGQGAVGDNNPTIGIAANEHIGCTIEPSLHEAWCTIPPTGFNSPVQEFTPAIGTPEALGMSSGCGTNMMFVLDAQGDGKSIKLYSFSVAPDGTSTPKGSVLLPEFTPASVFTQTQLANAVNWQVVPFGKSCTVAVMAPVLNASNGSVSFSLALVNATSMTEVVPGGTPLLAESYQISADDTHSAVLAYSADVSGAQGVTRIASRLNTASAKLTPLNSTSTILAAGSVLSLDGSSIDVIGWDPANDAAGLEFKPVPNN